MIKPPKLRKKCPTFEKNPSLRIASHVFSFISPHCIHYSRLGTGDLQELKMHHVPGRNQRPGLHYALLKSYLHDHRQALIYKSTVSCNVTWKNRRGTLLCIQYSTEHGVGFPGQPSKAHVMLNALGSPFCSNSAVKP